MREHDIAETTNRKADRPPAREGQAERQGFGLRCDPLMRLAPPADSLKAGGGASMLDRARAFQPARAVNSLLHLQRRCGNRYVQRVLAPAILADQFETGPGSDGLMQRACACGGHTASRECEECRSKRKTAIRGASTEQEPAGKLRRQDDGDGDGQPENAAEEVGPTDFGEEPEQTGGRSACPVTAIFLSMVAGPQKANCRVDPGKFGAARLAEFRVIGAQTAPGGGVTVGEQFTALDDPCGLKDLLQPVSFTTDGTGKFDDCYRLQSDHPLPPDCLLKVEQNHLVNGQIVSKNQITFGSNSVSFCHFERLPGKCDFGGRCKL